MWNGGPGPKKKRLEREWGEKKKEGERESTHCFPKNATPMYTKTSKMLLLYNYYISVTSPVLFLTLFGTALWCGGKRAFFLFLHCDGFFMHHPDYSTREDNMRAAL